MTVSSCVCGGKNDSPHRQDSRGRLYGIAIGAKP